MSEQKGHSNAHQAGKDNNPSAYFYQARLVFRSVLDQQESTLVLGPGPLGIVFTNSCPHLSEAENKQPKRDRVFFKKYRSVAVASTLPSCTLVTLRKSLCLLVIYGK